MTRTLARSLLAASVLALSAFTVRAGDEPKTPMLELDMLKEKYPPLNLDTVSDIRIGVNQRKLDGLLEDQAKLESMHAYMMEKWKAVQRARWTHKEFTDAVLFQAGAYTLALFNLENERREKLDAILKRQNDEFQQAYGRQIRTKKGAEDAAAAFAASPEYAKYAEERSAVQKGFMAALEDEKRKARTGQTATMDKLDELTQETQNEAQALASARRFVAKAIEKRRGEKPGEPEEPPPSEGELEERRVEMHLAALRTEYEAKTGETVEAAFQIWKGRKPYAVYSHVRGAVEGMREQFVHEPGDFSVLFAFRKAGTYTAVVRASDTLGTEKKATITIVVTGPPVGTEKVKPKTGESPGGEKTSTGGGGGPAPQRIEGTFQATIWHCNAELARIDQADDKNWLQVTGVPASVTIDPSGRITSTVRYELSQAEMHPETRAVPLQNRFWKVSFDLEGAVDWVTGKTTIEIKNGHDECGYEKDEPRTDNSGKKIGIFGHWRDRTQVDYSASLEGWTLPGPEADAWGARLSKVPDLAKNLKQFDLEVLGLPGVDAGTDGKVVFRSRGFFGSSDLGVAHPGGAPHRRFRVAKQLWHTGYDAMNAKDTDQTATRQTQYAAEEKSGVGGWYMKLLGAAPADAEPVPADVEPKKGELLGFGLWPTKPISTSVGSTVRARAMGVFGDDVYDAIDLSDKATWTASPGLTQVGPGEFKAATPGTYTITATHTGTSGGPMSSTITVVVKP